MNKFTRLAAGVLTAGLLTAGALVPADTASAVSRIPGMTKAQTTESAYRTYQDYYGKNNSCRLDFLESYRGVERDSTKADPEMRDQVVKLTTKKARKLNAGKRVFILKPLRAYRKGCQHQDKWAKKGYKVGSLKMQAIAKAEGWPTPVMVKFGDTTKVVDRKGKVHVS